MNSDQPGADLSVVEIVSILSGDEPEVVEPDLVSPPGLSPGAAAFYIATAKNYELRVDDWAVLEMAARQLTIIDEAQAEWERLGKPWMSTGYSGQDVVHPLIDLMDRAQKTLAAHLRQLRLPDGETGFSPFSHQGRGHTGGKTRAANDTRPNRRTHKQQED